MRSRYYGHPKTYEAWITRRVDVCIWVTLGRTRGHATREAAEEAILKLAARRGIAVVNDPKVLRRIQLDELYGDD